MLSTYLPGANELAVQKAKAEITRLIKEELIRLVSENLKDLIVWVHILLNYYMNTEKHTNRKHKAWWIFTKEAYWCDQETQYNASIPEAPWMSLLSPLFSPKHNSVLTFNMVD